MGKNTLKRSLIVGIIFLFLSTTCIPVLASEGKPSSTGTGKPDLIVSFIGFVPYGDNGPDVAAASMTNIGDVMAVGTFYLTYTVTRLISRTVVRTDTVPMSLYPGLEPGAQAGWDLIYESRLPKFGFFEFKCTVNPGKTMEESNYDNNDLAQKYVAFLGQWKEIG